MEPSSLLAFLGWKDAALEKDRIKAGEYEIRKGQAEDALGRQWP